MSEPTGPDRPTDAPATLRQFGYLLNAFEQASQSDEPAEQGYAAKRKAVLDFVAELSVRAAALAGAAPAANLQTAIDWIAGAAKQRASTREVTAGSYSAAAPAVGRSDQHGPTASAEAQDDETQLAILHVAACASAAADWQRLPLHAKDMRLLLAELARLRAALMGAPNDR